MQLKLFHKDSTKDMSELNTASIDLIITSPPYWNLVDYEFEKQLGYGLTYKHFLLLLKNTLIECMRVLKDDAFAVFVVADIRKRSGYRGKDERPRIYPLHADIINFFLEMDFDFFQHFIWRKQGINKPKGPIVYGTVGNKEYKGLASPPFLYSDLLMEHIIVFRKPGRKRTLPSPQERFLDQYNQIKFDDLRLWVDPVWHINSPADDNHPATFPAELAYRLIKMFSFRNDFVLDPFAGSGTALSVALSIERNAIGYELNPSYIDILVGQYPELTKVGNCLTADDYGGSR